MLKIGILTLSDRASRGEYEDKSAPKIMEILKSYINEEIEFDYHVIEDKKELIKLHLNGLSKVCDFIVTTGGTGPSQRDVTPEATEEICEKILPGFGEIMRAIGYKNTPTAILSRLVAGICKNTLIVNLPGNPRAIKESLDAVFDAIVDCVKITKNHKIDCNEEVRPIFHTHH